MAEKLLYDKVSEHYSAHAGNDQPSVEYGQSVAKSFGYTEKQLTSIPAESNLGLSCGNPLATASCKEGETIIDLGSGAGLDVFLASKGVGPSGWVIGVDMNADMLALAHKNKTNAGPLANNVTFIESQITHIPLDDGVADCVISNCVINLVPETDKPQVFREIFRLLARGGRLAVSDILAKKELPGELRKSMALYAGCIGGASLVDQYRGYLEKAGFRETVIADTKSDLNVYIDTLPDGTKRIHKPQGDTGGARKCCAPVPAADTLCAPQRHEGGSGCCGSSEKEEKGDKVGVEGLNKMLAGLDLNQWVGSYKIYAVKPFAADP